jgi:PHD/YefM family antitoxin component YafN of YafNO toxin-antitoxin module
MVKTIDLKRTKEVELIGLVRALQGQDNDHYVIQENGEPLAVLISQAEYERYREQDRLKAVEKLQKFLDDVHSKINHNFSEEEIERDVNEAIHEMRGKK